MAASFVYITVFRAARQEFYARQVGLPPLGADGDPLLAQ
jgi:hypothetical protein